MQRVVADANVLVSAAIARSPQAPSVLTLRNPVLHSTILAWACGATAATANGDHHSQDSTVRSHRCSSLNIPTAV
jgi:hypothetical protein